MTSTRVPAFSGRFRASSSRSLMPSSAFPFNPFRKEFFGPCQFGASASAKRSSCAIDEIVQHSHSGPGSFRRDFLRCQAARNCGCVFGKKPLWRVSRNRFDLAHPTLALRISFLPAPFAFAFLTHTHLI